MPKVFYCDKIINGKLCGENRPEKFIPGRYSTCKECRKKASNEIYNTKKNDSFLQTIKSEESANIRTAVESYLKNAPIVYDKLSIVDFITMTDENCSEMSISIDKLKNEFKNALSEEITNLRKLYETKFEIQNLEIQSLKMALSQCQNEISDFKKKIKK